MKSFGYFRGLADWQCLLCNTCDECEAVHKGT
jgi:hypothetical protein